MILSDRASSAGAPAGAGAPAAVRRINVVEPTLSSEAGHCAALFRGLRAAAPDLAFRLWIDRRAQLAHWPPAAAQLEPVFHRRWRKLQALLLYRRLLRAPAPLLVPTATYFDLRAIDLAAGGRLPAHRAYLYFHKLRVSAARARALAQLARRQPALELFGTSEEIVGRLRAAGFAQVRQVLPVLTAGAASSGAALAGATLAGATLAGATLAGGTLPGAPPAGGTLAGATSAGATLAGATSAGATLAGATSAGATLAGATSAGAADGALQPPAFRTLLSAGAARADKGFSRIVDLVEWMAKTGARLPIAVQTSGDHYGRYDERTSADLARLRACPYPGLQLIDATLDATQYAQLFPGAVCLQPYERAEYADKMSAVTFDALRAGAPVITLSGTSMAAIVARSGAGIVVEEGTAPALLDAAQAAVAQYGVLQARAFAAAAGFEPGNSWAPMVERLRLG